MDYERVTFADLEKLILDNYDANGRKTRNRVVIALRHPRPFFERLPAVFIAGDRLESYVSLRREEEASRQRSSTSWRLSAGRCDWRRTKRRPIRDVWDAWAAATRTAGVPGRILHDFRRTAVRRMERAGVPWSVAMKISGHKTESIYRRYAIVVEDIADGLRKVAAFQSRQARAAREG